jgi:hypothetical protein
MSNIFIHIGVPKTGTTAIQRFAFDNRQQLRELGLLYPEAALRGLGHHDFAFMLDGGYPDWAKPQEETLSVLAGRLQKECEPFTGDILLSSEDFYLFPQPEKLFSLVEKSGLAKQRTIRVIVYLRRQDELMVSWYNQAVKAQGFTGTFNEALEVYSWLGDYRKELERWSNVFGAENMMVRRYPSNPETDPDLMSDFWSLICPTIVTKIKSSVQAGKNISLNRDLLEIQRIINQLPVAIVDKRRFHHELMQLTAKDEGFFSDAPVASRSQLDQLLRRYQEGNSDVSKLYLDGAPLFPLTVRSNDSVAGYDGLKIEKVVAAFAWMLLNR